MPKKEPLKIAKKRIFKNFLKEAKQPAPLFSIQIMIVMACWLTAF